MRMLRIHLGAFDSLDHQRGRICAAMGPPGRRHGRPRHKLPASMPGDLRGLALSLVLELAEFALKLHRRRLRHGFPNWN